MCIGNAGPTPLARPGNGPPRMQVAECRTAVTQLSRAPSRPGASGVSKVTAIGWCNRSALLRDTAGIDTDPAARLVQKLREFAQTRLDAQERALLAILLAPGVARAYRSEDIAGVPAVEWSAQRLPDSLSQALHAGGISVLGLDQTFHTFQPFLTFPPDCTMPDDSTPPADGVLPPDSRPPQS